MKKIFPAREFPLTRLRRTRMEAWIRDLVNETTLSTNDLIAPLFVMEGGKEPVSVPMWAKCGPGDDMEPVISIMLPNED